MKKIIISALVLFNYAGFSNNTGSELLAVPTYTQVDKIKGGLFGYKKVSTDTDTNGNSITICENPGLTRCRIKSSALKTELTDSQLTEIDNMVSKLIDVENTKGNFVYNKDFLVIYNYIIDTNSINYVIYNKTEAKEHGFIL